MYELAVMVSITLSGYCGVPWWTVLSAATLLTLPTPLQLSRAAACLRDAGQRGRVAAVCFAGGECLALLLP
jgi:hypothetical protein